MERHTYRETNREIEREIKREGREGERCKIGETYRQRDPQRDRGDR